MDENLTLLDFKLLVDRATEILDKLPTNQRIDAINYALARMKGKFPDTSERIKWELCDGGDGNREQPVQTPQRSISNVALDDEEEEERSWNSEQRSSSGAASVSSKADLNQNFEKIICKEEFKFEDDLENVQPLSIANSDAPPRSNLKVSRCNAANSFRGSLFSGLPSSSSSSSKSYPTIVVPFRAYTENKILSKKLQILIGGKFSNRKLIQNFKFFKHNFFTQFYRSDENFNRNAFRQQILAALEFAVDHRKPFLRKFLNNLVLSGAIIPGVRPKQIQGISQSESLTQSSLVAASAAALPLQSSITATASPTPFSLLNTSPCNGVAKEFMDVEEESCITEETTQNTDSSEENARTASSPLNSILTETTPTEKDNHETKNARIPKDKQTYECLLCPKTYRKRKSLIDHYKVHPGHCHDCGQPNGEKLEEIIEHNRAYHAHDFPFICELCGESYSRRQQFHAHVEAHNKKDVKIYSCGQCGMEFPRKKLHRQHLDETGHKLDGAICEVCGAGFNSKTGLCHHMNRVHKKDNSFECHICHNRFTLKANLERHVQLHTEIKRTYVCDKCGSSYFTYPALRDHFSNAHTDVAENKCTLCGKTFSSVKSLQRHLPSHSEERPHTCNFCTQNFKWKTHLVRHKQVVHGNQPMPKKLKRFAKCENEELVPVEITPPPAKSSRKSNTKPKASSASKSSSGASTKSKTTTTTVAAAAASTTAATTPTTPQLESQNKFQFQAENLLGQHNAANTKSNLMMDINNFNTGAENFHFDPSVPYKTSPQLAIKPEPQQILSYEARYQQGSPQQQQQQQQQHQQQHQQHQQQQQIHQQSSQQQQHQHPHHHQPQSHLQQQHHQQQQQALHHQQQQMHQHQQQQHHQQQPHHLHQSQQPIHQQQQAHHQTQQSLLQSPQRHLQSPRPHLQSPRPHMQSPRPHLQSPQPHLQPHQQPHLQSPQPHLQSPQPHIQPHLQPQQQQQSHLQQQQQAHLQQQQQQQQQPHLQQQQQQVQSHLQQQQQQQAHLSQQQQTHLSHQQQSHLQHQQQAYLSQQPPQQQQPSHISQQQQPHHSQQLQYPSDWHNINFNASTSEIKPNVEAKEKYFSVIEVSSNDFMGLPMAEMPKNEQMDPNDLLNFQNIWTANNQQLNFNNGNVEPNTYNNIGSILTNLELIGNNSTMDFNNYEMISEHQMGTQQQLQHHAYMHPDIDPNNGNINHPVINYDYNSQNHTITDISNTILREQDPKSDFQYHQQTSNYDHTAGGGGVYNPSENEKVILPPLTDYMHQPTMQQQQQQSPDVVYYPVKNEM